MILHLYSVKDTATNSFSGIFMAQTDEEAKRFFANWTRDPENAIHSNPEDYELHAVGWFDRSDGTGHIDPPLCLAVGSVDEAEAGSLADAHRLIGRLGAEVMNLRQEVDRLMRQKEAENK